MTEIEVKIRVEDANSARRKLLESGAKLLRERYFEENTLYDFRPRTLWHKRQALRIRNIGKKTYVAFKGTPQKSRKFKVREEHETEVKNRRQLEKILKSTGLIPCFRYQKHRTVFKRKSLTINLDEMSIGTFIELEGERNEIVAYAKTLGYSKSEFIKSDYVELLLQEA